MSDHATVDRLRALALVVAVLSAPAAWAGRDAESAASCMAKQLRKVNGSEGGRLSAMQAHFDCFPDDPRTFSRIFDGAGPLAANPSPHFELFFATRPSVNEREWAAKAVGALAGAEWSTGATARFALLLRINIKARPTAPLDAAARLDEPSIESFWRVLFGSAEGFYPDRSLCKGRLDNRACIKLTAISPQ